MERVIDRLILFQQSVKKVIGGQNKFESYIGLSTGYISNMSKNSGSISSDVMLKLKDKFPDLNLDWLITGKGSMLKSEAPAPPAQAPSSVIMIPFEEYKKSIAEKDEVIKDQAHKIGMLEHELQLFTSKKQTALGMENASTAADHQRNIPEAE